VLVRVPMRLIRRDCVAPAVTRRASLPGNLIMGRHLTGVDAGSLGIGQSGNGENLLDHRVLSAAVLVDVGSVAATRFFAAAYRSRRSGSARKASRTARWLRSDSEPAATR